MLGTVDSPPRVRRPPFARRILGLRRQGQAPHTAALVVDGWEPIDVEDQYREWRLVVPDAEDPAGFDFSCLAGLCVLVIAGTAERVQAIARAVLACGALHAYGWTENTGKFEIKAGQ